MEKRSTKHVLRCIIWYKEKIDYNGNCRDMNEYTQNIIEEFGHLAIPPSLIIEKKLVNYIKRVGYRFNRLKKAADLVARKWQHKADLWLADNNMTEKYYLEQLDRVPKTIPHLSPRLNGARISNQSHSGSDNRQNYHSSSSQEAESHDSQHTVNQRSRSINHRSDHHSFARKSSSPLQLENPVTRNLNPAEYNANLSIDPKEVTPNNKLQGSPVKPDDRFHISLKENMFKAVKLKEPIPEKNLSMLLSICSNLLRLPHASYPKFVRDYKEVIESSSHIIKANSGSGDCTKSINGKTEKKMSTHLPNTLHNNPSTSQQGTRESSRSCPESKHDGRRKHMESILSAVKAKELREEQQPSQDNKNLPFMSQGAVPSSRSDPGSNCDKKRKHSESHQSVVGSKESKSGQQSTHMNKNLLSMSQQTTRESSRTCSVSKHDKKRKLMESSQPVKAKEPQEEQQPSHNSKLKHVLRTESVVKGKESKEEQQPAIGRALKCKETFHSVAKAHEFKDGYQSTQDGNSNMYSKQAIEVRNCDKNHIKKRDSTDQSALLVITSSKKERTSMYHGGRKSEVLKLKDLCIRTLHKAIKQNSDPTKYINKIVDFEIIEPVLVLISPEKLQKLEEEMSYLKDDTDGVWKLRCDQKFKSQFHLKKKNENWRAFYQRCCMESEEKLRNVAASISALKSKPDRQIKLTTVDSNPTKRQKTDYAVVSKKNANKDSVAKPLPNSCHPSNFRSDVPFPAKGLTSHIKSNHKIIKKDAPLMHKAKKTMGQLHRIHRS